MSKMMGMYNILCVIICTVPDGCFVTENDRCGNGIVDEGETCDCGSNCDADPCCNGEDCTLASGGSIVCRCV